MTATKARIEEATEEEARQEAKDHIGVTTIEAIKATATETQHRMMDHINLVIGPEVNQDVEEEEQTTEGATIATVNLPQQIETTEAKEQVIKEIGALDVAGPSGGEEEVLAEGST